MLPVVVPQAEQNILVLRHFSEPTKHAPVEQGAEQTTIYTTATLNGKHILC